MLNIIFQQIQSSKGKKAFDATKHHIGVGKSKNSNCKKIKNGETQRRVKLQSCHNKPFKDAKYYFSANSEQQRKKAFDATKQKGRKEQKFKL